MAVILLLLYKHLTRAESGKTIIAAKFRYPTKLRRPPNSVISTMFDRVERDIENVLNDIYKIAFHHLR